MRTAAASSPRAPSSAPRVGGVPMRRRHPSPGRRAARRAALLRARPAGLRLLALRSRCSSSAWSCSRWARSSWAWSRSFSRSACCRRFSRAPGAGPTLGSRAPESAPPTGCGTRPTSPSLRSRRGRGPAATSCQAPQGAVPAAPRAGREDPRARPVRLRRRRPRGRAEGGGEGARRADRGERAGATADDRRRAQALPQAAAPLSSPPR